MAKLSRIFQKIFGVNAGLGEIGQFGSLAEGSPTTTTDPNVIQSLSRFQGGWNDAIIGNNSPAIEDVNALWFLAYRQLAYMFENGVSEWDDETNYFIGSIVNDTGTLYYSLVNDNLNNLVSDGTKWRPVWQKSLTTKGDLIVGDGTKAINVAVGADGTILEADSTQGSGVKWGTSIETKIKELAVRSFTQGSINPAGAYLSIAFSNNTVARFLAVGDAVNRAAISYNGSYWTTLAVEANLWESVCWGESDSLFVAVASTGTNRVFTWSGTGAVTAVLASQANPWSGVTHGLGTFVAVARSGTNRVMTSTVGTSGWTNRTAAEANSWEAVAFGNNTFVAVASTGTNRVMTSADGTTWATVSVGTSNVWTNIKFANGWFIAVGDGPTAGIMRSQDGTTWSSITTSLVTGYNWDDLAYGNGIWVVVASNFSLYSLDDGATWKPASVIRAPYESIAYGQGLFTCLGQSGETVPCISLRMSDLNGETGL